MFQRTAMTNLFLSTAVGKDHHVGKFVDGTTKLTHMLQNR